LILFGAPESEHHTAISRLSGAGSNGRNVARSAPPEARLSSRHADFQKSNWLIRFIFINQLPGRSLHSIQDNSQLFHAKFTQGKLDKYTSKYI
jgi:hypothetical protein